MERLPAYVDCNNKRIEHCDYYILRSCPETCGFAKHIKNEEPQGIGAVCEGGLFDRLRRTIID